MCVVGRGYAPAYQTPVAFTVDEVWQKLSMIAIGGNFPHCAGGCPRIFAGAAIRLSVAGGGATYSLRHPELRFLQLSDAAGYWRNRIAIGLPEPTAQNIHSNKLAVLPPVGLVRKNHPLTRGRPSIRDFNQTPQLTTDSRVNRQGKPDAKDQSSADPIYTTAHFFAVPLLLVNSDLLLVTSQVVANLLCAQYPLVTVPLPTRHPPLEPHIFWHQRTDNDPAQKWMREKIIDAVRGLANTAD